MLTYVLIFFFSGHLEQIAHNQSKFGHALEILKDVSDMTFEKVRIGERMRAQVPPSPTGEKILKEPVSSQEELVKVEESLVEPSYQKRMVSIINLNFHSL